MEEIYDVAVAGAGLAGLTAAATAAREGARVVVLDAHPAGGQASTTVRDGFRLNMGPHALYLGGPGRPILAALGVTPSGGPPSSDAWALVRGRAERLPTTPASLGPSRLLGARDKAKLSRMLLGLGRSDPAALADQTAAAWLAGLDLSSRLSGVIEMLVRVATYSHAPDILSADTAVTQLHLAVTDGVSYLDGGWQPIVDGLVGACTAAGVELRSGAAVTAVAPNGGGIEVSLGDDLVRARAAVLAVGGPGAAAALLPADPGFDDRLGPPSTIACLDLGLAAPPARRILFGIDTPLYLSTHSPPADLAPPGRSLVHVMRYQAPGDQLAPDDQRAELFAHAERAGITAADVVLDRYLHRMTAITALPTAASGGLAGRPGHAIDDLPGVFVAGDWVGPIGMLSDASLASAVAAGRAASQLALAVGR